MIRFKIISCGYEADKWLPRCIESIASQTYPNYDVIFVDDASESHKPQRILLDAMMEQNKTFDMRLEDGGDPWKRGWFVKERADNVGPLQNQHEAIHYVCEDDEDVIVIVDSDDFLPDPQVLERLAKHYDDDTLLTYGSYKPVPASKTCPPVKPYPAQVIADRSFREFTKTNGVYFNHLRTYRYGLYKSIDPDTYFIRDGTWLRNSIDLAAMIPMLEAAGDRHKYLKDVLLCYNSENPISYWRINSDGLAKDDEWTLSRPIAERYSE
jgi:glycosyltransferase involved in cell wall biosynthesis